MPPDQSIRNEYDSPWKEIIEQFFPEFIAFFFPEIFKEIDWNKPYDFLDNELEKITKDAEIGKRYADKLVKVFLISGLETWLLVHIEIQGYHDKDFEYRMFIYNRRIGEKYNKEVVSLAILCDHDINYRPHVYNKSRWGCELNFKFPIAKLLDFKSHEKDLENTENIFSIIVTAHLKSIEVKEPEQRKTWKMKLVRSLYRSGFDRAIIIALFRFIDWVIALPKILDEQFTSELQKFEKEQQMQYVTSVERVFTEKGELKSKREDVIEALEINVEMSVPKNVIDIINQESDLARLKEMLRKAIKTSSLEEFQSWLNS